MIKCRKILYSAQYLKQLDRGVVFSSGLRLHQLFNKPTRFEGIAILDTQFETNSTNFFEEKTSAALKLILETDPQKFRRVQKQIKIIVNVKVRGGSRYRPIDRSISINLREWPFETKSEWSLKEFASTIVFHATYGKICQYKIPYVDKTRMRIKKFA